LVAETVACGGTTLNGTSTTSTATPPNGPIPRVQLPQTVADTACMGLAPCCKQAGLAFDEGACETRDVATFNSLLSEPGALQYDPAAGEACVNQLIKVTSACGYAPGPNHACDWDLLVGTVAPGGACQSSRECTQPATCTGTPLTCLATPHGKLGDPCVGSCDGEDGSTFGECYAVTGGQGLFCFEDESLACGPDGTCQAITDENNDVAGDSCSADTSCGGEVYCDVGQGKCVPKKPPFASCQSSEECGVGECEGGHCTLPSAFCSGMTESNN
jgi:hypothetical protein